MLRYEILSGLSPDGPIAVPFGAGGWTGSWGGHREGLVVQFHPDASKSWVGNFQPGSSGWQGVLDHPNKRQVIVVSRGQGYVVEPEAQQVISLFADSIQHAIELPALQAIVFSSGICFEAINIGGLWWRSPRISWDEFRNISVDGNVMRGEASSPLGGSSAWFPFTLDLLSGRCDDGIYEKQMQSAVRVKIEGEKGDDR